MNTVRIDGETLRVKEVVAVARDNAQVEIPFKVKKRVEDGRKLLVGLVKENKVIYGVTTGFGALSNINISPENIKKLQVNLIRSHSVGVGKLLDKDVTRAIMLLRANTLAKGHSGVRFETLNILVEMLNKGVHPSIPMKGSVGASGDLAPLSHMTLVMMGEGEAEYREERMSGKNAMSKANIQPAQLEYKEGLALNNGTQMMTGVAALSVFDAVNVVKTAEVATAMSLEALLGIYDAFDERIHAARPHQGQMLVAHNIRRLVKGSRLIQFSEADRKKRPQDPYCLRCAPQVLGAARDAVNYVKKIVKTEINSATDNPLVFTSSRSCISGGNFHGQPIAVAMDFMGVALSIIGNISERRIARLIDKNLNRGLPSFLIPPNVGKGINSGFMPVQYTAAALASENKVLAHPASVDSIPTSANFEDFVSMGSIAALKAREILGNTLNIVSIELLCAAQAVDFRDPTKLGEGTKAAYSMIRQEIPVMKEDRPLHNDILKVVELVKKGLIVKTVEKKIKLSL